MSDASVPSIPDPERPYEERKNRRTWLLLKALENLPLNKALALAAAAERFLCGDKT